MDAAAVLDRSVRAVVWRVLILVALGLIIREIPELLWQAGWHPAPGQAFQFEQNWRSWHRLLGIFALTSTVIWVFLFLRSYGRFGKRVIWALLAAPMVLYWDGVWYMGYCCATFL
jgi:hypothetical protein